ncbi:protein LOW PHOTOSYNTHETIC EFFICIENCY 1, chloroplastic-like [Malania oleifera]|uniref:protein LOW PHOTOSYNTHETIC EFFICIENCY 1, chloroplastic-like n=1 Tax=Malania oleifera TaxID=397392 RepID=UPI0025AEB9FD|nr:protein LOW PHOTOSYNTHETIC EFFICIENCY 1, chloroplastic-like [Malania oleifera]
MQALGIWAANGDFWGVSQLEFDLGISCCGSSTRRRKKLWNPGCPFCPNFNFPGKLGLGHGFSSVCPKFEVRLFHGPKRDSLSDSVALAWALTDQEAVGNEFVKENSNSVNGLSEKSEREKVSCLNLDYEVRDSYEDGACEGKEVDSQNKEGIEKESRIDVRVLALRLRFSKTADDVQEVLKDEGEVPLQVFSTIIKGFGKDKKLDSAFAIVEWLKRRKKETGGAIGPNLFVYNSLLGAMKQSKQYDQVERVMNDMAMEGVVPTVVTYNTLMGIYLERGRASEALDFLEEIQKKCLSPSPASYSIALLAYLRVEDGFGALRFFVELREKYLKGQIRGDADEDWENEFDKLENFTIRICYQVMRQWLVKGDNFSPNVLKLITEMDKAQVQLGRAEHERLVWACTRGEQYNVAKELYNRIRERHSDISLSVCNHVIWLMGKAKKWWAALEIYENLLDKGPKPNNLSYELIVSHFNVLLTAARKKGIWRWGVRLLDKMEDKGLKPGSREWNAVLIACSKASEPTAAVQIFRRMVEKGEKPTIISYGALLSALEKGKLYDEAFRVWEHMIKVGVEPNLYAYTIMASVCVGQGKFNRVDSIIREMASSGIEPTVVTYNAIISGCARKGMGSVAYEWFHRMKVQNITPNEVTYEMLIEALAKDGKPRLALEFYLRARNEGLNLALKAYDAVIQSSQVNDATIDVSVLGPRPPDNKKRVET